MGCGACGRFVCRVRGKGGRRIRADGLRSGGGGWEMRGSGALREKEPALPAHFEVVGLWD